MLTTKIAAQLISKEPLVSRFTLCRRVKTDVDTILHDLGISDLLETEKERFANLLKGVKISARNLAEAKKLHVRKHLLLVRKDTFETLAYSHLHRIEQSPVELQRPSPAVRRGRRK